MPNTSKRARPVAGRACGKTVRIAGGAYAIRIKGELTISSAGAWQSRIAAAFERAADECAVIDLSRVTEIVRA